MNLVVQICLFPTALFVFPVCSQSACKAFFPIFHAGFSVCLQALVMYSYERIHKLSMCLRKQVFTWVNVKLAFHRLGNALQFDSLQGAVSMDSGGQAAQRLPDEAGHLPHCEDLQQLAINGWKCPQEHRLGRAGQCSVIWRLNGTGTMNPLWSKYIFFIKTGITLLIVNSQVAN